MIDAPRRRRAGRVLVRDDRGAVLLCHATDGSAGWWFTPGGGSHGRETARDAAHRELAEETGLELDLPVDPVLHRRARFEFLGGPIEQVESFWHVRLGERRAVAALHLEDYEAEALDDWRWCTDRDLGDLDDPLYPVCLADLLARIDRDGPPSPPWVEEHLGADDDAVVATPATGDDLPWWTGPAWRT